MASSRRRRGARRWRWSASPRRSRPGRAASRRAAGPRTGARPPAPGRAPAPAPRSRRRRAAGAGSGPGSSAEHRAQGRGWRAPSRLARRARRGVAVAPSRSVSMRWTSRPSGLRISARTASVRRPIGAAPRPPSGSRRQAPRGRRARRATQPWRRRDGRSRRPAAREIRRAPRGSRPRSRPAPAPAARRAARRPSMPEPVEARPRRAGSRRPRRARPWRAGSGHCRGSATMSRSGRRASNCAVRRGDEVPTRAPCRQRRRGCRRRSAGRACRRARSIAAIASASGRIVSTSFIEWTERSVRAVEQAARRAPWSTAPCRRPRRAAGPGSRSPRGGDRHDLDRLLAPAVRGAQRVGDQPRLGERQRRAAGADAKGAVHARLC